MEFKSQIATTREQSERMLALGIKPETADMVYHYTKSRVKSLEWELQAKPPTLRGKFWTPERIAKLKMPFHKHTDGTAMTGEEVFDSLWGRDIPAWSLSRLLEMMPLFFRKVIHIQIIPPVVSYWDAGLREFARVYDSSDIYENIISMIAWLISNGYFNTEYLKGETK